MSSHVVSAKTEPRRNPEKKGPRKGPQRRPQDYDPAPGKNVELRGSRALTDRELGKLPPGEHADGKIPGLMFRVRETGGRSWALLYWAGGRRRRLTLGGYPALGLGDARSAARTAKKAVNLGHDPAAERRESREAGTFAELAERYIERWALPRKRTWKNDQWLLEAHVLPRWKHLPVSEISRRDARELLEKVADKAPVGVNRVRALLSKVFNYGISIDVVETNPVTGTARAQETARSRVLSEDEIRKLWTATEPRKNEEVKSTSSSDEPEITPAMSARFRLPLVTAQRGGEVNGMRWADVDLGAGIWTIPAGQSKNKLPHRVPLSPLALEILSTLPREGEYVLAGGRGKRQQREAAATFELEDFHGHDLRRTAASYMTSIGIPRFVVARVLNHVETGVTAVYDRHSYDLEKRDALTRWEDKLRAILQSEPGRVVEFRR